MAQKSVPFIILDNGGKTFDRYTFAVEPYPHTVFEFTLSENADSPQGVCQMSRPIKCDMNDYRSNMDTSFNNEVEIPLKAVPKEVFRKINGIVEELSEKICQLTDSEILVFDKMPEKTKYVVAKHSLARGGECLGYIDKERKNNQGPWVTIGVLFAPGCDPKNTPVSVHISDLRPATRKDFDRFRVMCPKDFVEEKEKNGIER